MRGCLWVIVLGVAFLIAGTWLAGPSVAGALVHTGLTTGGVHADDLKVGVEAEPRWKLLAGRADRVTITGTRARLRDTIVGRLDLELRDVELVGRRAGSVTGRLDDVVVVDAALEGGLSIARIDLDGGSPIEASVHVAESEVERVIADDIRARLDRPAEDVSLVAPDRLAIELDTLSLEGRLSVDTEGALVFRAGGAAGDLLGAIVLVPAGSIPIELESATVRDGRLVLRGRLEPGLIGIG
jgi:hypothetical protein